MLNSMVQSTHLAPMVLFQYTQSIGDAVTS